MDNLHSQPGIVNRVLIATKVGEWYMNTVLHFSFFIFVLPKMDDLKLSPINYDKECKYLVNLDDNDNAKIKTGIKDLITYCIKLRPYMSFSKCRLMHATKLFITY